MCAHAKMVQTAEIPETGSGSGRARERGEKTVNFAWIFSLFAFLCFQNWSHLSSNWHFCNFPFDVDITPAQWGMRLFLCPSAVPKVGTFFPPIFHCDKQTKHSTMMQWPGIQWDHSCAGVRSFSNIDCCAFLSIVRCSWLAAPATATSLRFTCKWINLRNSTALAWLPEFRSQKTERIQSAKSLSSSVGEKRMHNGRHTSAKAEVRIIKEKCAPKKPSVNCFWCFKAFAGRITMREVWTFWFSCAHILWRRANSHSFVWSSSSASTVCVRADEFNMITSFIYERMVLWHSAQSISATCRSRSRDVEMEAFSCCLFVHLR